jgi:23S rRNA pseudouridine2605 synthase
MAEPITRRIGLARALSKLGYCSRSKASELIRNGHVTMNSRVRRDPETPSSEEDEIKVDGETIGPRIKTYLMMNKPRGIVTTASDEKGRETVYNLLHPTSSWLAPVGRLDKSSEGLLLFTNDSEWAARIASPETHLDKTYHVQLGTIAGEDLIQQLIRGVRDKDAEFLRAKHARLLRSGQKNCWLEIILDEGRNRQIRRMMETLRVELLRLIRVGIGPLQLGDLLKGKSRPLSIEEKKLLDQAIKPHAMKRSSHETLESPSNL